MKRLLCATDLLPKSECAIDRAGMLAHEIDADLSLLHVVSPTSQRILEQSLQIAIARMKSRVRPPLWRGGPAPNVLIRTGNPGRLILDTVAEEKPDLLIVGAHRKRGVVDALEGTIAQKILNARKCALLMVQRPAHAEYSNVLLALDLSVDSSGVVRAAESLLRHGDARATVVHACEPQYEVTLLPADVADVSRAHYSQHATVTAIQDLLREETTDSTRYEVVVAEGRPVPALRRAIEFHRPDLLILGTRGNGPLRRALLGSVANQLLKIVECDVLVVPRGSVETSSVAEQKTSTLAAKC
jgi:nucleotide-binding universal stress UspA family protein